MRLHPYLTVRILNRVNGLEDVAQIAGNHHECMNATGYPATCREPRWVCRTGCWPPR